MNVVIGSICGWIAAGICILLYVSKNRDRIFAVKMISDLFWIVNMFLLGLYTGLFLLLIAVARSLIFSQRGKRRWAESHVWLVLFLILTMVSPIVTWAGSISLLPAIGSLMSTTSYFCKKPVHMCLFSIPSSILWALYALLSFNYPSMVSNLLSLISSVIGIGRYLWDKQRAAARA